MIIWGRHVNRRKGGIGLLVIRLLVIRLLVIAFEQLFLRTGAPSLRGKNPQENSEYGLNRLLESRGDEWETNYCPSLQTKVHFGRIIPIGCSWGGKIRCLSQRLFAISQVNNGFWSLAFCPQFSVSDWTFSNFGLQIKCTEQRREVSAHKRGKGKELFL